MTLYLVWNLSASDPSHPENFSALRDIRQAFGGQGTNVFMVKASYWLSR